MATSALTDPADVLVFVDSGNDLEMLREIGLGVAMGNCVSGACEAAVARISDHTTDAIADFIRRAVLGSGCE